MGNLLTDYREARSRLRLGRYERWQLECIDVPRWFRYRIGISWVMETKFFSAERSGRPPEIFGCCLRRAQPLRTFFV